MTDLYRPKGLSSAVSYQDPKAAYRWLEAAFGFEPLMVLLDGGGNLAHSEMTYGTSVVMVGSEWSGEHKSPKSIGGKNTQSVHVQLPPATTSTRTAPGRGRRGLRSSRSRRRSFTATAPTARRIRKGTSGPSA